MDVFEFRIVILNSIFGRCDRVVNTDRVVRYRRKFVDYERIDRFGIFERRV